MCARDESQGRTFLMNIMGSNLKGKGRGLASLVLEIIIANFLVFQKPNLQAFADLW